MFEEIGKHGMKLLSSRPQPWVDLQHLVDKVREGCLYLITKIFQPHNEFLFCLYECTDGPIIRECFPFHCELIEDTSQPPNVDFVAER